MDSTREMIISNRWNGGEGLADITQGIARSREKVHMILQ
jgi:hypothetical protein